MNEWHEPKTVSDAKNAAGYFFCLAVVTCGSLLLFGGMICPFFWPYLNRHCDGIAAEYVKDNPKTSREQAKRMYQQIFGWGLAFWFLASWAFFILVIAPQIH